MSDLKVPLWSAVVLAFLALFLGMELIVERHYARGIGKSQTLNVERFPARGGNGN